MISRRSLLALLGLAPAAAAASLIKPDGYATGGYIEGKLLTAEDIPGRVGETLIPLEYEGKGCGGAPNNNQVRLNYAVESTFGESPSKPAYVKLHPANMPTTWQHQDWYRDPIQP